MPELVAAHYSLLHRAGQEILRDKQSLHGYADVNQ